MEKPTECKVVIVDGFPVVMCDGVKIAERGAPGTPEAYSWVSVEPGYIVRDCADMRTIEVEITEVRIMP
jgi:hypothetical protein